MNQRSLIAKGDPLGVTVIVLDALFLGLAAAAICIRLWSRRIQGLRWTINDYAVIVAWPLTAGLVATAIAAVLTGGCGQHIIDVDPKQIVSLLKVYLAAAVIWGAANTAVKISILHLYISIFGVNRTFRISALAMMALVVCFGTGIILLSCLGCRPLAKIWDPLLSGPCPSITNNLLSTSIINVVIDLIIFLLPIPMIWRLNMARKRKATLTVTFGLGLSVCIITILRIVVSAQLDSTDPTYDIPRLSIVTDLEPLLGMIVACLPLFPPVFRKLSSNHRVTQSQPVLSSTVARLRSSSKKPQDFQKFDDFHLLTDLEINGTRNHITRSDSQPDSILEEHRAAIHDGIKVKQGWDVRSQGVPP